MNKNKRSRSRLAAGALAAGLLAVGTFQAGAVPIAVPNQSFETDPITPPWTDGFRDPQTFLGNYGGYLTNTAPATGSWFMSLAVNYSKTSSSVDTGYDILSAGQVFTLTVAIGRPSSSNLTSLDYLSMVNLQLDGLTVAGNTALTTEATVPGGWSLATVTYTAVGPDVGASVGILLGGPTYTDASRRRYFDNVELDVLGAAPLPEPTTSGLILGSLAAFFGIKRLRRKRPLSS